MAYKYRRYLKAREEHEAFLEKSKNDVFISFEEIQEDKRNQAIISNYLVEDMKKGVRAIKSFNKKWSPKEIKEIAGNLTPEQRELLLFHFEEVLTTIKATRKLLQERIDK